MAGLPPAILFDLDDTILAFSAGRPDLWADAFARHGGELPTTSQRFSAVVAQVVGEYWSEPERAHRGRLDLVRARREVAALAFARLGLCASDAVTAIADHFTHEKERLVAPFPGAIETLQALRAGGVRLGLVTNGSSAFQRRKLSRFQLTSLFEAVAIEGELGVGKPDPRPFWYVLERMQLQPSQVWMVGDNLHADIAGAQALGMHAIWHDHARAGLPSDAAGRPDRIIHTVTELKRF